MPTKKKKIVSWPKAIASALIKEYHAFITTPWSYSALLKIAYTLHITLRV